MADMFEKYRDDLPDFVRGRLDQATAAEILRAAQQDAELRAAIETERSLDRWLEYYEVPELSEGFEGRFWRRFHDEKLDEQTSRANWMFKLIGPLAAGVLIAVGLVLFLNQDQPPKQDTTAENHDTGSKTEQPTPDVDWQDAEVNYITGDAPAPTREDKLSVEDLELLKTLNNAAFKDLDNLGRPEDLQVADELDSLNQLAEGD